MDDFNIFKIEYGWYECEHEEFLVGKKVSAEKFENDLLKAKKFAERLKGKEAKGDYLGKGYSVECLPEYYRQIIWHLTKRLGYVCCDYDEDVAYDIDDGCQGKKIQITKCEKKIDRKELK